MTRRLIEYVVNTLVDRPQLVTIEEMDADGKHIIEVRVASHDLPKLIGKEGRVFRALRAMVTAVSSYPHTDLVVDIKE